MKIRSLTLCLIQGSTTKLQIPHRYLILIFRALYIQLLICHILYIHLLIINVLYSFFFIFILIFFFYKIAFKVSKFCTKLTVLKEIFLGKET